MTIYVKTPSFPPLLLVPNILFVRSLLTPGIEVIFIIKWLRIDQKQQNTSTHI